MSNSKHKTGRKPLKLGTVENYHHHWYLLIWLVYLTLFAIAEHVVTDNYWVSYLPLDDKIPFCRYFIIPYCLWHPLLFLMTLSITTRMKLPLSARIRSNRFTVSPAERAAMA